jgi:protein-tyrosine phosphatase
MGTDTSGELRILFVCMGNICRSPSAERLFSRLVRDLGLEGRLLADSAGTHDYNLGLPADSQAALAAARRGIDLGGHRARQVSAEDFRRCDYVIAMDRANLRTLRAICPEPYHHKLHLLLDFADAPAPREVPDPYGGDLDAFDRVLDLLESGVRGLLGHLAGHR